MFNFGFKYITQDMDGGVYVYKEIPNPGKEFWIGEECFEVDLLSYDKEINDWKKRIVNLETHWFKIEDGLLIQTNKRSHADLAVKYFLDNSVEVEYLNKCKEWIETNEPIFYICSQYREKPKPTPEKEIWYRNYLDDDGHIQVWRNYVEEMVPSLNWISKPKKLKIKP